MPRVQIHAVEILKQKLRDGIGTGAGKLAKHIHVPRLWIERQHEDNRRDDRRCLADPINIGSTHRRDAEC